MHIIGIARPRAREGETQALVFRVTAIAPSLRLDVPRTLFQSLRSRVQSFPERPRQRHSFAADDFQSAPAVQNPPALV